MSNNIVTFTPNLFQVGESYSVSSRYEHTFIGKCVQFEPDKVVFETPYGNLPITPTMAVSQEYHFEQLHIRKVDSSTEEPQKIDDEFIKAFMEHIDITGFKDPAGPIKAYHGLIDGSADELDDESKGTIAISPEIHKCEVPLFNKKDIPVTKVPAPNFNMKEW